MAQVLHLISENEGSPICGTTEQGKFKGFTTNLPRALKEDFLDSMYLRDLRRCSKCCAKLGVEVMHRPYKPERHFKIPFAKKDMAKKAGMWWCPETRTWYYPSHLSHFHIPGWAARYHAYNKE